MSEVRKVQKPNKTGIEPMVRIPIDMGFKPGDNLTFEKIDERTIKLIKVA